MTMSIGGTSGLVFPDSSTQNTAATGFGFKNRIINGAMMIDQRNAGASVTNTNGSVYTIDRWLASGSQASKYTIQQSSTVPSGFTKAALITSSSSYSLSSGDFFTFRQYIEGFNVADLGWGTADAQPITISFKVRSSLTGTFGGVLLNSAANRSYPFTYTISSANTYETKTVTIAGDTTGTWLTDNGIGIQVVFGLGVGSTYSGTAGSWSGNLYLGATGATSVVGTNGATFYITGVQLEKGSTATSFDYRPYGTELALCQRYLPAFYNGNGGPIAYGSVGPSAGATAYFFINFPVPARVPPTGLSYSSLSHFTLNPFGSGGGTPTSMVFNPASSTQARIVANGTTNFNSTNIPCELDFTSASGILYFTGCEL